MESKVDRGTHLKPIRCPYCVEAGEFKLMEPRNGTQGWHICASCGHLTVPGNPEFQCPCAKCANVFSKTRIRTF